VTRYFFDMSSKTETRLDHKGQEFETLEEACQLADLLAIDYECCFEDQWAGAEIRVLNISGQALYAVRVQRLDSLAA
jgi:hypothetical protein